jgi:hypothetical protein
VRDTCRVGAKGVEVSKPSMRLPLTYPPRRLTAGVSGSNHCGARIGKAGCAALVAAAAVSGCVITPEEEKAALPAIRAGLHYIAESRVQGGRLAEVAAGLGSAVDNFAAIRPQLDRIAASEDPFGEALVTATCYGLSNIAEQARQTNEDLLPPSAETWESFLENEVAALLPAETAEAISHARRAVQ